MKLSLIEYGSGIEVEDSIRGLVDRANKVIQKALHLRRNALILQDGKLRALGVAGTIRLSRDVELEIIPKMLDDQSEEKWKESLFLLSALSKYGNIITTEHIHSNTAYKDSLYDIAGRILAREYSAHRRKPIRQYRREQFADFSIDGEINFDKIFERNPDGIPQDRVSFDKVNPYNATIKAAMQIVLPYVKETAIRQMIGRDIEELGKQPLASSKRLKVPSRNREWTEIYNLSFDIVTGMGSSLENGEIMSPSFIVDTWRIWEWLVTIAIQIGLGTNMRIIPQATIPWGQKTLNGRRSRVNVIPDVAIYNSISGSTPVFLMDAKYKTLPEDTAEVDRADLYEAYAFCNASGAKRLFLTYPAVAAEGAESGSVIKVSDYDIGDITISAIKVAFGSITKQGDIMAFCHKLSSEIMAATA